MGNKEYAMFNGRFNRWFKAREDAYCAAAQNDAGVLLDALDNLDRKAELLIRSTITSDCFQDVRNATLETRIECIKRYTNKAES